jgi:2-oxoisovalerate dehydrogenase E1 component alpha subunit
MSGDPSRYHAGDEERYWPLGDPIERPKAHLIRLGEWSDERHQALAQELEQTVRAANAEAQTHGVLGNGPHHDAEIMFESVYEATPWHVR